MVHLWKCPLQFQTLFYLAMNLSCLDSSLAGKPVKTAMRFPDAHSSGVGEGSSKALADLKAESIVPNRLFVGHLFTPLLLLEQDSQLCNMGYERFAPEVDRVFSMQGHTSLYLK